MNKKKLSISSSVNASITPTIDPFHRLRSLLLQTRGRDLGKILSVISPTHGDGRSFVASKLACSFAQSQRNVLLIDADFRSPSQSSIFNCKNNDGFFDYLSGQTPLMNTIQFSKESGISIVPSGVISDCPSDLMDSPKTVTALLKIAELPFDIIIFDTSPYNLYPEISSISSFSDSILICSRMNHTKRSDLIELNNSLGSLESKILGSVLLK